MVTPPNYNAALHLAVELIPASQNYGWGKVGADSRVFEFLHPDKKTAEQLFRSAPELYKDPNHKPEIAIPLGPFEALIAFRKQEEIFRFLETVPELAEVVLGGRGGGSTENATRSERKVNTKALPELYSNLMRQDAGFVREMVQKLVQRLEAGGRVEQTAPSASAIEHLPAEQVETTAPCPLAPLILRLQAQYPGDVGIFSVFFLNYVQAVRGEFLFCAANVPHAYLSGDCIECMALSDNVIRAGLTPKFKDVDLLLKMCDYRDDLLPKLVSRPRRTPGERLSRLLRRVQTGVATKSQLRTQQLSSDPIASIFLNTQFNAEELEGAHLIVSERRGSRVWTDSGLRIAADGAGQKLLGLGLHPDLIVGDMDSSRFVAHAESFQKARARPLALDAWAAELKKKKPAGGSAAESCSLLDGDAWAAASSTSSSWAAWQAWLRSSLTAAGNDEDGDKTGRAQRLATVADWLDLEMKRKQKNRKDSVGERDFDMEHVQFYQNLAHVPDQNSTDLEKALSFVHRQHFRAGVHIVGKFAGVKGRTDHFFALCNTLYKEALLAASEDHHNAADHSESAFLPLVCSSDGDSLLCCLPRGKTRVGIHIKKKGAPFFTSFSASENHEKDLSPGDDGYSLEPDPAPPMPNPHVSDPRKEGELGEDYLKLPEPPEMPADPEAEDTPPPRKDLSADSRGLIVNEVEGTKTYGGTFTKILPDYGEPEENGVNPGYQEEGNRFGGAGEEGEEAFNNGTGQGAGGGNGSAFDEAGSNGESSFGDGAAGQGDSAGDASAQNTGGGNGNGGNGGGGAGNGNGSGTPFRSQDSMTNGRNRGWFWLPNGPLDKFGQALNPFSQHQFFRAYPKPKEVPPIADLVGGNGTSRSDQAAEYAAFVSGATPPRNGGAANDFAGGNTGNSGAGGSGDNANGGAGHGGSTVGPSGKKGKDKVSMNTGDDEEDLWGVSKGAEVPADPLAPPPDPPGEPCTIENKCNPYAKKSPV
eukprot:g5746.t1